MNIVKPTLQLSCILAGSLLIQTALAGPTADEADARVIKNPYAGIDWEAVNAYRANFHCHSVLSDGRAEPDVVINNYAGAGYQILAITDHDNFHRTREGERRVEPTTETTWPWTRWIDAEPEKIWHYRGMETSAYYPTLGDQGMLAIRGNELTTDPHIISLFNNCGFAERGGQTDDERLSCVAEQGGLSYFAHPSDYREGGRWEGRHFAPDLQSTVAYFGSRITRYPSCLGIEYKLAADIELFDALLKAYYRDHNIFLFGSDDRHNTRPPNSRNGRLTLVLAPELTEEAVRNALVKGHTFVGRWGESYPEFKGLDVDTDNKRIQVHVGNHNGITWVQNGMPVSEGATIDFSQMQDSVLRFEVRHDGRTFYSQAFYIY